MTYTRFAKRIISVAEQLDAGACGGSYAEACILVSALVSGISADLWPGTGNDQRRFTETWVRYADPALHSTLVSLPLLYAELLQRGQRSEADLLARISSVPLGKDARIVTRDDVDRDEPTVVGACTSLSFKDVRRFSYPSIFYRLFRSGLVHEYQLSGRATSSPMTTRPAHVSYSNHIDRPSGRRIHFHFSWLAALAESIATNASSDVSQRPLPSPTRWWTDG